MAPIRVIPATDPVMSDAAKKILIVKPKIEAPLDPGFAPVALGHRNYMAAAKDCKEKLEWALPRNGGCGRGELPVFPDSAPEFDASVHLAGVLIQQMFWERSAQKLLLSGPAKVCEELKKAYSPDGKYAFEVLAMPKVCGTPSVPFEVSVVPAAELPPSKDTPVVCGSDASGCRLAFDLGKSDIKTVAVKDNEVVFSQETEWDVTNPDPDYHYDAILKALKEAASKLPKIDAIGGSATGTVSADNEATWCDIFPNVPPDVYAAKVVDIFKRLAANFGENIPLKVINDGEVTAIAGAMMAKHGNLMGISMGSSEGAGYADADKNLSGWINELCYIQLDLNPDAPTDPWTKGHTGLSHMYLGQRGATKLAHAAGVPIPDEMKPDHENMNVMKHEQHAKCLKLIQAALKDPEKEPQVRKLYETVGVYLGYALGQYAEHFKLEHVIILGRVSSGEGGTIMCNTAHKVLEAEFPELAGIKFHFPDEHFKRVGQCIAAAALPTV